MRVSMFLNIAALLINQMHGGFMDTPYNRKHPFSSIKLFPYCGHYYAEINHADYVKVYFEKSLRRFTSIFKLLIVPKLPTWRQCFLSESFQTVETISLNPWMNTCMVRVHTVHDGFCKGATNVVVFVFPFKIASSGLDHQTNSLFYFFISVIRLFTFPPCLLFHTMYVMHTGFFAQLHFHLFRHEDKKNWVIVYCPLSWTFQLYAVFYIV